jgi:hypothetical protein
VIAVSALAVGCQSAVQTMAAAREFAVNAVSCETAVGRVQRK